MTFVRRIALVCAIAFPLLLPLRESSAADSAAALATSVSLNAGWQIQSSCDAKATG